jgi:hypothetical protein
VEEKKDSEYFKNNKKFLEDEISPAEWLAGLIEITEKEIVKKKEKPYKSPYYKFPSSLEGI